MFRVNETLAFNGSTYRILHLEPERAVWICLDDPSAFPTRMSVAELQAGLEDGTVRRAEDPFADIAMLMPEKGSTAQIKRDRNYALIRSIVDDPGCYDPQIRGAAIRRVVESGVSTKRNLYTLLRRYWQRGLTPNSLLPDYRKSGGKGKRRQGVDNKLGRPRVYTPGIGAIIDEQTERLFRIAIDENYLKEGESGFPYAHRRFKDRYVNMFPDTPLEERPTRGQMYHFYKREYGKVEQIVKRMSRIEYSKDVRPLSGTAGADVAGPGSRFEIDATIADIYLVSDSDRQNIIGRPVVYIVVDVFSRMVAGLYIGFSAPSYAMAIQALAVAMIDKVKWCRQYGFEITHEQWPVVGLPDAILADRGELLGSQIEALEKSFSVRIENAPPYRGDAKGIVERNFRTIQANFKPYAPGVVGERIKKRGGKDYRLDAKLTIREFREILIASILMRNQFQHMEKYDRTSDMPDDLPMTPLAIWNWGVQHRTGRLRVAPEDVLRISLLPRTKARVSAQGISAFGLYYTSPEIIQQGWLHRTKEIRRPDRLEAAYDPATADCIFLFPEKGKTTVWKCQLTTRCREFSGCSFWDVWDIKDRQKKVAARGHLEADEAQRKLECFIKEKIATAKRLACPLEGKSDSQRIRDIRRNKSLVVKEERSLPLNRPDVPPKSKSAKVLNLSDASIEKYGFPSFIDELYDEED